MKKIIKRVLLILSVIALVLIIIICLTNKRTDFNFANEGKMICITRRDWGFASNGVLECFGLVNLFPSPTPTPNLDKNGELILSK